MSILHGLGRLRVGVLLGLASGWAAAALAQEPAAASRPARARPRRSRPIPRPRR